MSRIPQQFIDELMTRVDIIDVIDSRVPLKKSGRDYSACCPFHNEKTPSFTVSQTKQFYHCFGCGAHGTALGFLMDYEHMDFPDAVRELAGRVGLEVPQEAVTASPGAELYEVLEQSAQFFRRQLKEHPQAARAVDYLKKRGLSGEIAARFGIGFAPPGWDNLLRALGPSAEARLLRAGMLTEKDGGKKYDRFRDRIMFPILDRRGRTIGFGGRVLDDGTPKYLNSPETPVFHKGRELYGLYEARTLLRDLPRLLVVEGYMDVVALAQHDIGYAVATLGTATTDEHLEKLFRATPEVLFCFDGDKAGRAAAWRALETTLPVIRDGRQARFMFLPEGEDPDTLVRKLGRDAFEALMEQALPLSTFMYSELAAQVDMTSIDGRARLAELAKPLLARLPEGLFRQMMIEELSALVQVKVENLATLSGGNQGAGRSSTPTARPAPRPAPTKRSPVRLAIALLLQRPGLAAEAGDPRRFTGLALPGIDLLMEMIELILQRPDIGTGALLEHWRDTEAGAHLLKLAQAPLQVPEAGYAGEFADILLRLEERIRAQRVEQLYQKDLKTLTPEEKAELQQLLTSPRKPGQRPG
jgi:DNA primase